MKHWNCYECPHCGSALDFGERCDCLDKQESKRKEREAALDYSQPQIRFKFAVEEKKERLAS